MAAIRNIVLASDFSCKDTYCFGADPDKKILDKRTYVVQEHPGVIFDGATATAPMDESVPATDFFVVGTLADGHPEVIVADGGIVKEVYDNCVVEWKATYNACDDITWEVVNIDLSDINPAGVPLDCSLITI